MHASNLIAQFHLHFSISTCRSENQIYTHVVFLSFSTVFCTWRIANISYDFVFKSTNWLINLFEVTVIYSVSCTKASNKISGKYIYIYTHRLLHVVVTCLRVPHLRGGVTETRSIKSVWTFETPFIDSNRYLLNTSQTCYRTLSCPAVFLFFITSKYHATCTVYSADCAVPGWIQAFARIQPWDS
jgi:hypothetical protein